VTTSLTIGITTRNRPTALGRCLHSIASVLGASHEVIVFDDASAPPAAEQIAAGKEGLNVRIVRDDRGIGPIAGRDLLVRQARHDIVFLMDDDAAVIDRGAIESGIAVMKGDAGVAAVAFAQAESDGRPWPERMQPGRGGEPARVPAYIGFAHLLRKRAFLAVGGYRSDLIFYGEEKDLCIRLMDAGYTVVYLPQARVAHIPDPSGRDARRYVRQVIRNDCLTSLYNEPWPLALVGLPARLLRYRRMAARIAGGDAGGVTWVLRQLRESWPRVRQHRRAVSWATVREWRRLGRTITPYHSPHRHQESV
jgi:GT2 family glycosyltransferase